MFNIDDPPVNTQVLEESNLLKPPFQYFLTQLVYALNNKIILGEFTATPAATSDIITVDDLTSTGFVFAQTKIVGANGQQIISAEAQNGQILITYSGMPGSGHVFYYMAIKGNGD